MTLLLCDLFGKRNKLLYNILAIKLFKNYDKITKNNTVEYYFQKRQIQWKLMVISETELASNRTKTKLELNLKLN